MIFLDVLNSRFWVFARETHFDPGVTYIITTPGDR
jgi:hypothetical protein